MAARWPLIAAACSLPIGAQPSSPSLQDALQVVLAYEAAQPHEYMPICVPTRTDGMTFDEERRQLRVERQLRPVRSREVALHQQTLSALEQRRFDWRVAPPPSRIILGSPPRLDVEQAELLSAAALPFATTEPTMVPPVDLKPIPAPLSPGVSPECHARLTVTAPVVTGDLLFVQTSYVCGGLCGVGWLYALRREGSEWRIVAVAWTWVS
jgi:hypothetical protein